MKSLLKCGLLIAVIGTGLLFTAPQQAEARRYWAYYPAYTPVYTAYYPRRVVYPRRVAYYGPVAYPAPAYPVYYGPVAAPCGCN
jgi:hypothetical protein